MQGMDLQLVEPTLSLPLARGGSFESPVSLELESPLSAESLALLTRSGWSSLRD